MKLITKESELQSFLDKNKTLLYPPDAKIVGVYFQFAGLKVDRKEEDKLVAIAISSSKAHEDAVLLLLASLQKTRIITGLRTLLSNSSVYKVMYNVHQVASWLGHFGLQNPKLVNCIDLQLLYEITVDTTVLNATILQIANSCLQNASNELVQTMQSFKAKLASLDDENWKHTPLSKKKQKLVVQTAQLYANCYVESRAKSSIKASCALMTRARWEFAVTNKGHPAIWFDPKLDNQPRSLECLINNKAQVPKLKLECEQEPLLDLLPTSYKDAILGLDNYHELVDICIDTGKPPFAYAGKKQRIVLNPDDALVSKDVIDEILMNLGGEMRIGNDNRVGIDKQLHRISVMRSKMNEIYAITMRWSSATQCCERDD